MQINSTLTSEVMPLYPKTKIGHKNNEQDLLTLSGEIAHELKTPLAIIQLYTELLENSCKNMAFDNTCTKIIMKHADIIKQTVKNADGLIGILLMQIKGVITKNVDKENFACRSIGKDVADALEQYPFRAHERKLVTIALDNDFKYFGNQIITHHLIFNLMKNALRAIKNAEKGTISVRLAMGQTSNQLIFKDTATGIPQDLIPTIFNQIENGHVTFQNSTGLGLVFCKTMMQCYGGSIVCDSKEGKYTEFTLSFPKIL